MVIRCLFYAQVTSLLPRDVEEKLACAERESPFRPVAERGPSLGGGRGWEE